MNATPGCPTRKTSAWCGLSAHRTAGLLGDMVDPHHRQHDEPDRHHRAEQLADAGGAVALHHEQDGQHHQRDRHDVAVQRRRRDLEALDRTEHRDRRRDDAVAVEDRGAEDADEQQPPAQLRAILHRLRRQRQHRDQAALAVVVGAQDQHHVLDRDDHRQGPEHEREHAVDVRFGQRHVAVREHFLQRIQRAGPDVSVDDPDGAQGQRGEAGGRAVWLHTGAAAEEEAGSGRRAAIVHLGAGASATARRAGLRYIPMLAANSREQEGGRWTGTN